MKVFNVRNAHDGLPQALSELDWYGVRRESRAGLVLQHPETPVAVVYNQPMEKVVFHPWRDANPFFHLYESLWMLNGRDDLAGLQRYVSTFDNFSDDGVTLRGAYGNRWRHFWGFDQLRRIIRMLRENKHERRAALGMWHPSEDLGADSKDVPCNMMATFQVSPVMERLDMTVFCRSNDVIWGTFGANAVHFAFLLEYMSRMTNFRPGMYTQVSVNFHAYSDVLNRMNVPQWASLPEGYDNPYKNQNVYTLEMPEHGDIDALVERILHRVDCFAQHGSENPNRCIHGMPWTDKDDCQWSEVIFDVLSAHAVYRATKGPERFERALEQLPSSPMSRNIDWVRAAREWIERRQLRAAERLEQESKQ